MVTYLYALVAPAASAIPSSLSGIDGAAVRALPMAVVPACVAWVSGVNEGPARSVAHVAAHDAVTDAASAAGLDVIPARFGQSFADDAALLAACGTLETNLRGVWATIAGCVEMTVTVRVPVAQLASAGAASNDSSTSDRSAKANSAGTGRAYLERRAADLRAAQRVRDWICPWHGALWEDIRAMTRSERQRIEGRPLAVYYSHLVERAQLHAYRVALQEWRVPGANVLVSGPHAPYSFALAPPAPARELHRPASRP